jgi:hypothetical protein
MRDLLNTAADRMLGLFLPKARAGACACFPGDGYYQYRCYGGQLNQRRWCNYNCHCTGVTCGAWVTIGDC